MMHLESRLSWLVYGAIAMFGIFSCIACYYAGYYTASKELYSYYMAESLNDRLAASLYTLYGDMEIDSASVSSEEVSDVSSDASVLEDSSSDQNQPLVAEVGAESGDVAEAIIEAPESSLYDAYLIGFGAKRSADRYAEKLHESDMSARVLVRENKNSRGKKILWYQVAIGPLPYHKLLEIVELLKYRDKLEGVVFMEHKA